MFLGHFACKKAFTGRNAVVSDQGSTASGQWLVVSRALRMAVTREGTVGVEFGKCGSPFYEAPPVDVRSVSPVSKSERPGAPSVWDLGSVARRSKCVAVL